MSKKRRTKERIKRANRRKMLKLQRKNEPLISRKNLIVVLTISAVGIAMAAIHSAFAILTGGISFLVAFFICNYVSVNIFGKEFEYHSQYESHKSSWSDIILAIPFILIALYPMFILGEIADCYAGTDFWSKTIEYCE